MPYKASCCILTLRTRFRHRTLQHWFHHLQCLPHLDDRFKVRPYLHRQLFRAPLSEPMRLFLYYGSRAVTIRFPR
jgi:hypothetical protein